MIKITRIGASISATNWKDPAKLEQTVKMLEKANVSMIHLDIADGKFVKNKTFDEKLVDKLKGMTWLLLHVHLMVENPEAEVDKYIKAGADILSLHFETCKDLENTLKKIKSKNVLTGVVISPKTPTIKLKDILKTGLVDVVSVMGVEPGGSGQAYIPGSAERVAEVREMNKDVFIAFDGGVTVKNSRLIRKAGANILISGATIFGSKDIKRTIRALKGHDKFFFISNWFSKKKAE